MKKPINRTRTTPRPTRKATVHYDTIGDMLAARHLREHGSYPMWRGRQLRQA